MTGAPSRGLSFAGRGLVALTLLVLSLGDQAVYAQRTLERPRVVAPPKPVTALDALRSGDYDEALRMSRAELDASPSDFPALSTLVRTLLETGAYTDAEKAVRAFTTKTPASGNAWNLLGEVLLRLGKRDEAETSFVKAVSLKASDTLAAEASQGILLYERGLRAEANQHFERLIEAYNSGRATTASDLIAVGRACRYLGVTNPSSFRDALKAFDEAAALDETHEARLRTGELFLQKFNGTEARAAFEDVLRSNQAQPQALLGLARARDFDGERGVPDLVSTALKTNPNFVEARAYRSGLLLALEDFPAALDEATKALQINPSSADALAALAAAQYVKGDAPGFAATRAKAEQLYPKSGDLLVTVAEAAVRNRLYRESAGLARDALSLEPQSWSAHASLGQNQLRLGDIEGARKSLETSFAGDPYNVWVKNTLDLMDTFVNYETLDVGTGGQRFRLFLDKDEAGVLAPPMEALAVEALRSLSARYGYQPTERIRIEVYPSHADFSVRTVGLAGLGALGVCFGPVVALDSPQARDRGDFNWGSTLWHELAHAVTMGASSNRVPRWLTEGLSVYEERRARPGWGDDLSLEFLLTYQAGELLPLGDLNNGFVRPKRPEQVGLSYYQASLVVEHIEKRYGLSALRDMLTAYGEGATTEEVFEKAIGRTIEQVDADFQAELEVALAKPASAIQPGAAATSEDRRSSPPSRAALEARLAQDDNDFLAHLGLGRLYHREKRQDEALRHLERAAQLWPGSAGGESPYVAIADIKEARGDSDGAIAALRAFVALNENHDAARAKLSSLLEAKGLTAEALAALDSSVFIYPFDPALHERRAALAARLGRSTTLVDARRAIVELDPVDKAEAYFQLAAAEFDAGNRQGARRSILRSLEIAPRFERAQELLLKIHRDGEQP